MWIWVIFGLSLFTELAFSQCPQPEVPENGRLVESQSQNSTVNYQCDPGFILVGNDKRVCLNNRLWSGTTPICALNVALHKPAIQSSTKLDSSTMMYYANFSTDGNFDGTCSATLREKIAWWQVDLLEVHRIYAVEIMIPYSPQENQNGANEIQKIHILTSLTDDFSGKSRTLSLCYKHEGVLEKNRLHTFICIKESSARYIRIVVRDSAINMCEVVVLSTSVASEWQCPNAKDMQLWGTFNGLCYYGSFETAPWFTANTKCQDLAPGSTLISDFNSNLQNFLVSQIRSRIIKPSQFYWLGLSNVNSDWQWVNGKRPKISFWADPAANSVAFSTLQYGVTMAEPFQWNWLPSLQAVWYNYICQSPIKFCTSPAVPLNGGLMAAGHMRTVGSTIFYYCNKGYMINGEKSRTCQENGVWSDGSPSCIAIDCGRLNSFSNLKVKYINESSSLGSIVEYECPPGQRLLGSQVRICQSDGSWSADSPRCDDVDCGMPEQLEHGNIMLIQNTTTVGSIVEYVCESGFGISGTSVRHCLSSGLWTPSASPICAGLITGFIIAIVILLIVLFLVVFYIWKKKKMYDTFSMSTLGLYNGTAAGSQTNISSTGMPGSVQDVLYAFPSTVTTGISTTAASLKDSSTHYYAPSISSSIRSEFCQQDCNQPTYLRINLESAYDNNAEDKISSKSSEKSDSGNSGEINNTTSKIFVDSIKKREIERILKDIQIGGESNKNTIRITESQFQATKFGSKFTTWKNSNFVEYLKQKFVVDKDTPPTVTPRIEDRSQSPTLSELFSFDDEDLADNGETEKYSNEDIDLQGRQVCDEIYSMVGELCNAEKVVNSSNNDNDQKSRAIFENCQEEKIYDVPPDASAFLSKSSLARTFIKNLKTDNNGGNNHYALPYPTQMKHSSNDEGDRAKSVPIDNAIETVHTYC